jgi:hypothetical protein
VLIPVGADSWLFRKASGLCSASGLSPNAPQLRMLASQIGEYLRPRQFSSDVVAPGHDCSAETPLAHPPDGRHRGRVQMVSLNLRDRAGEKLRMAATSALTFTTFS